MNCGLQINTPSHHLTLTLNSYSDGPAQAAIDAAQAAGGGVVYFPSGRYLFSPPAANITGPIMRITESHMVLRGDGSQPAEEGGTELYIDGERDLDDDLLIKFSGVWKGIGVSLQHINHIL